MSWIHHAQGTTEKALPPVAVPLSSPSSSASSSSSSSSSSPSPPCPVAFFSSLFSSSRHTKKRCLGFSNTTTTSPHNDTAQGSTSTTIQTDTHDMSSSSLSISGNITSLNSSINVNSSSQVECEQLPEDINSLSLSSSPSPLPDHPDNDKERKSPLPLPTSSSSPPPVDLVGMLSNLPLYEFKYVFCPLLPHLLHADPRLPALIIERYQSRARWQCMDKHLLGKCFSYLMLWDMFNVAAVSTHWRAHSKQSMIWKCVCYHPMWCPPIPNDRSFNTLCTKLAQNHIPIKKMTLSGCPITADGLQTLTLLHDTLTYLDLSCMTQVTDHTLIHMSKLQKLNTLKLCGCLVTDCGIRYLRCLTQLTLLTLLYTKVTQACLPDLEYLPLTSLSIASSRWDENGYQALGAFTSLKQLRLDDINVKIVDRLKHLTQMEELHFAITPNRAHRSRNPCHTQQQLLPETNNQQQQQQEQQQATAQAVSTVSSSSGAAPYFCSMMSRRCASFGCSAPPAQPLDLSSLTYLTNLRLLQLSFSGEWERASCKDIFAPLTKLPSLTSLQIDSCLVIDDTDLLTLSACSSLTELQLEGKMTCRGVSHLSALKQLSKLTLIGDRVRDVGVTHLASLPLLKYLHLSYASITEKGVDRLVEHSRQVLADPEHHQGMGLSTLVLEYMMLSDATVRSISQIATLSELKLMHSSLSATSMNLLKHKPALHVVGWNQVVTADTEPSQQHTSTSASTPACASATTSISDMEQDLNMKL